MEKSREGSIFDIVQHSSAVQDVPSRPRSPLRCRWETKQGQQNDNRKTTADDRRSKTTGWETKQGQQNDNSKTTADDRRSKTTAELKSPSDKETPLFLCRVPMVPTPSSASCERSGRSRGSVCVGVRCVRMGVSAANQRRRRGGQCACWSGGGACWSAAEVAKR